MTALGEGEAVELPAQREAGEVPGAGRLTAAVEEEGGRPPRLSPVEVVEAHSVLHRVMVGRRDVVGDLDPGQLCGQAVVGQLVGGGRR